MKSSDGTIALTADEVAAIEGLRRKLNFSPEEIEAFKRQERRRQAVLERMADATLEEQQRLGAQLWAEQVERPRATRRIATARKPTPAPLRPTRPERGTRIGRRAAVRTSTPSRGDPDDGDPEPEPEQLELDRPARRLYTRKEIADWIAEQMASLDRLRAS